MDRLADPRVSHTWRVYSIVNSKRDNVGPSATGTTRAVSAMLAMIDGSEPCLILNPVTSPELDEISEVHEVLAAVPPVLITQSIRGYAGTVSGLLVDDTLTGRTARQQRDSIIKFRSLQGQKMLLYLIDAAFEAVIYNIDYKAVTPTPYTVDYAVSFEFFQTDF